MVNGLDCSQNCLLSLGAPGAQNFTIMSDMGPVGMIGVVPFEDAPEAACAWFLSSDRVYQIKPDFLNQGVAWLNYLQKDYPLVVNWVFPGNTVGLRWAEGLGFVVEAREKHGIMGESFLRVVRRFPQ